MLKNNQTVVRVEIPKNPHTGAFTKDIYAGWFRGSGAHFCIYRNIYYYENNIPDIIKKMTIKIEAELFISIIDIKYKLYK